MNSINFNSNGRINLLFKNNDMFSKSSVMEIINLALPIMQMYKPTQNVAKFITGFQNIHPHLSEIVKSYKSGEKYPLLNELIKAALTTSFIAGTILFPIPGLILNYTYQSTSDLVSLVSHLKNHEYQLAAASCFKILDRIVHIASIFFGGPELLLLSLALQAGKELVQAKWEIENDNGLAGYANLLYAALRILEAKNHAHTLRRQWFGKKITQEDLNRLLFTPRIGVFKPFDLDDLLDSEGFSNQLANLCFFNIEISNVIFKNLNFNNCNFFEVTVNQSEFYNVNFYNSKVEETVLRNNIFEGCWFEKIEFISTNIIHCDMYRTSFNFCSLKICNIIAKFNKSIFANCDTENLNFSKRDRILQASSFKETEFLNSKLNNINFTEFVFSKSSFLNCDLFGSKFNNAHLIATDFISCNLSETQFFDVSVKASKIIKCELKNCLLFDSKKIFEIINSTPHIMTKPVVAMAWDYNGNVTNIAKDMRGALIAENAIVFLHPYKLNNINPEELYNEATQILKTIDDVSSRPQTLLKQSPVNGEIAKIKSFVSRIAPFVNGIFLKGGSDIEQIFYDKNVSDSKRDISQSIMEIALLQEAKNRQLPVLGVCRGSQMINVFFGGTLKDVDGHSEVHDLKISPALSQTKVGITAREILGGDSILGVSMHHQAADKLGEGVIPVLMHRRDVEMTISQNGLFVGTQFHPEAYRFEEYSNTYSGNSQVKFNRNRNIYANFSKRANRQLEDSKKNDLVFCTY